MLRASIGKIHMHRSGAPERDGLELNRFAVSASASDPDALEGPNTKSRKQPHAK
jgi:hypothetical protein